MRSASSGGTRRPVRWTVWLTAGALTGLATGFVIGLARPRAKAS